MNTSSEVTPDKLDTLEEAFEQVKYFIEDLDHANGTHCSNLNVILLQCCNFHDFRLDTIEGCGSCNTLFKLG